LAYILNIETATTVCSVSVSKNSEILADKELENGFTHAENLHLFIDETLNKAGITLQQLNAVAVSKGPGSYTGLRIGASAAKGLAYALNIPLIALDTLLIMTEMAREKSVNSKFFCPMIDARRMEVFTCIYDQQLVLKSPVEALIVDETSIKKFDQPGICFFGNGMNKCEELLNMVNDAVLITNIKPSAKYMGSLAFSKYNVQSFENVAYFEPFYLKDFLIVKKRIK
jgi:tRNA threonylcarbamoyladenosine biosynthesis protein TsaB